MGRSQRIASASKAAGNKRAISFAATYEPLTMEPTLTETQ